MKRKRLRIRMTKRGRRRRRERVLLGPTSTFSLQHNKARD